MDMQMPDIKGIDTYRQMLTMQKKHAEFIFISAFATPELEKKTKELGCIAFLHKPIRAEEVIKLIRSKSLLSVLIYISNEGFRSKIIKNLQNENCNLEIASDFDEALILIRQIDYNYLIIDEDSFSSEQDRIKSSLQLSGSHTELILINEDQSTDEMKAKILQT
jgi:DNA-binding response OmpR family regulator